MKFLLSVLSALLLLPLSGRTADFSPFSFAVLSDTHLSVPGKRSPANTTRMFKHSVALLQASVAAINNRKDIQFTVVLGDLTKDAEPWNVDRFKEVMEELNTPWYVVLGNHDISPVDTRAKGREPGLGRAAMIWAFQGHGFTGPVSHWSLDPVPGVHMIGLDSTRVGDWGGKLTGAGLDFLDRDLTANRDKLTIVLLHHLLLPYTKAEQNNEKGFEKFVLDNAEEVNALLQRHGQVAMTLSGHRHISTRYIKRRHIAHFAMPSTVSWPMRYTVFTVSTDRILYRTYDVPCEKEIWEEAKSKAMAADNNHWPRSKDTPRTPEGNRRLEDIMLAEASRDGEVSLQAMDAQANAGDHP